MYCTIEVQEGAINSVAKHTLFTLANPSHSRCPDSSNYRVLLGIAALLLDGAHCV